MSRVMKDSGIEWVGKIPEDWDMSRLSWIVEEVNEKNKPIKTDKVLSLMKDIGVIPYDEKGDIGNKSKENLEDYKIAYKNTIVINSMNVIIGSVGLSKYFGAVSPVYYVYKTLSGKANIEYLNYIFQTKEFQQELKKYGKGIMEIRLRITSSDIKKNFVPFPNITIQSKIAYFLDEKCEIIDKQIENNKKSIELLEEYRKSLIDRTVYYGKHNNKFKQEKLKFHVLLREEKVVITANDIFIGLENIESNTARYLETNTRYEGSINQKFYSGDLLVNKLRPYLCKSLIPNFSGLCTGELVVIKKFSGYMKYLMYYSISPSFIEEVESSTYGTKMPRANWNFMKNLLIPLPSLQEQKEIADYLDDKCYKIDRVIEYRKQIIEKLEEYKKSLIYEAVTGKIEV